VQLPWQNQKNHKMHWAEKSEKLLSLLTKTENQRLNWRKPANRTDTKTEKPQFYSEKTEKPNQKWTPW